MKNKVILYALVGIALFSSCSKKEVKQGSIVYNLEYQLPDSLQKYLIFLPKTAQVYFKGDSTISIQQGGDESTTTITHKPTSFIEVLLKSGDRKYVVDYNKKEQDEEKANTPSYTYQASTETKVIANYKALKYILTNKATGETGEAWYTKDIAVVPNSVSMVLDTAYGVPLAFTSVQHGMTIKTTVKQIKFEPVADGTFLIPAGYQALSPGQLRNMPAEN